MTSPMQTQIDRIAFHGNKLDIASMTLNQRTHFFNKLNDLLLHERLSFG